MRFIISRTSQSEGIPCKEAKISEATNFMDCSCPTIKEALQHDWVRRGIQEQKDGFVRVYDKEKTKVMIVEINSLEQLLNFQAKYGDIIIQSSDYKEIPLEIEIYDGYRE